MSTVIKAIVSVFTAVCMLPSLIGAVILGTDNINRNTCGDISPGGRFTFVF